MRSKYFVLDPESKGADDVMAKASRDAMVKFAESIDDVDPIMASALLNWVEKEEKADVFKWDREKSN